jgi:hypothetical protein
MTTSSSPGASPDPVALDAALLWRGDVLAFRHLADHGVVAAGDGPGALGPIAGAGFAFARLDASVATVLVPAGAIATVVRADAGHEIVHGPTAARLFRGDVLDLVVGALVLRASAIAPVSLALDAPRGPRARGALFHIGLAAAAHLAVLGLSLHAAMASMPEDDESQADAARELIVRAENADHARSQPVFGSGDGSSQGATPSPRSGDGRRGGGEKAAGDEGKLGDREASSKARGRYAVPERMKKDRAPSLARDEAITDAASFGMIGLLAQGPVTPAATWSSDLEAHGGDPFAARGAMWATEMGSAQGVYGLGLSGIGEGGGGTGEGIGLGHVSGLGHLYGPPGSGTGGDGAPGGSGSSGWGIGSIGGHSRDRLGVSRRIRAPRVWGGDGTSVIGRLPPEAIQRVIRQNFGRFRFCYENGLHVNPTLAGRVTARFAIGRDGAVLSVADGGSDISDPAVVSCVVRAFYGLSFPQPEGGIVTVTYPIVFSPRT